MPVEAKTILNKSPITVTNADLPIVVEPVGAQINANDNPLWSVEYKEFYQGRVNCDEYENEGPYLTLRSALMNAFNDNNFAFIILEGYIITLINTVDCIYVFDSHARNNFGMIPLQARFNYNSSSSFLSYPIFILLQLCFKMSLLFMNLHNITL